MSQFFPAVPEIYSDSGIPGLIFMVAFLLFFSCPVWIRILFFIHARMEYNNVAFVLTNRRALCRTGIIGLDYTSADFTEITEVKVKSSFIQRHFDAGNVEIYTSTGKKLTFLHIRNPYMVYAEIYQLINDIGSDILYPNATRPETNTGYDTNNYGLYQISEELDTSKKDDLLNEIVWDYKELHSAIQSLKPLLKSYYNSEIVPVLFEYEFLK